MSIGQHHISAAIITFNEEKKIEACMRSLDWVDEIVVVDSLSTDRTKEIAQSLGAKIIDQKFLGHIEQKNLALQHCSHDLVISLDADERVGTELKQEIIQLLENTSPEDLRDGYSVARKSLHLGKWIMHGGWYPDRNIRLLNRTKGKWGGYNPHDKISVEGEAGKLKGSLEHLVFEDLAHNVQQNNSFSSIMAQGLYDKGKKPSLLKLLVKPPFKFFECYIIKRGFLDGVPGFIIAVGAAYSMFLKFSKLWELHRQESKR